MSDDLRLYVHEDNWESKVRRASGKMYCHFQDGQEDHFHLILNGEIYVTNERTNYCLSCAEKKGLITRRRPTLPT